VKFHDECVNDGYKMYRIFLSIFRVLKVARELKVLLARKGNEVKSDQSELLVLKAIV